MQAEIMEMGGIARLDREVYLCLSEMRRGDAIRAVQRFVERIIFDAASVAKVFVSAELDELCKTIALMRPSSIGNDPSADLSMGHEEDGGTIILVSELSKAGGHNELVRDIIRLNLFVAPIYVVQTDCFERCDRELSEAFGKEVGVPVYQVSGESLDEKFDWILGFAQARHPVNLLLLAHNQDALAISAAFAAQYFLNALKVFYIHHGDHHLSLGAATNSFLHIDPHNIGYFHCRHQLGNKQNHYWPLTVNGDVQSDPRTNFIGAGVLTTCSSGRSEKFDAHSYLYDYFDLIPQVLAETLGVHVHIGPLTPEHFERIESGLANLGICVDRFVHIPWVKSLAQALARFKVDLYISSFPLGGGKATLEAMAAGVPLLMHESYRSRFHGGVDIAYPGAFVWRTPEELYAILRAVDAHNLAEHSILAIEHYLKFHSEKVLLSACNFDSPQDESLIPELSRFRGNAVESFLDDQRSLNFVRELEVAPLESALQARILEVSRLNELVQKKDELLALTGESIHRLEKMVEVKDLRLQDVGQQLESSRGLLSSREEVHASHVAETALIIAKLQKAEVELVQMIEKAEVLSNSLSEFSGYPDQIRNLERELKRLVSVSQSKDLRLKELGLQLETLRRMLNSSEAAYAHQAEEMLDVAAKLKKAEAELSCTLDKAEKLNKKLIDFSRYQTLVENLEQRLATTDLELTEMKSRAARLSADIAVFSPIPIHVQKIENELAASIDSSEQQRNYFYAEVDKRDKLLKEAQLRQDQLNSELKNSMEALAVLQRTRWFRLRKIILARPFGVREATLAAVTVAGGVIPHRLRSRLSAQMKQAFGLSPNGDGVEATRKASSAYVVKTGPGPSADAPKIVHALANFMTGGSSRLVVDLVEHLGKQYRHSVLTSFNPDPPAYVGLDVAQYSQPVDVDLLVEYFTRTKPDLVHVHYWGDCDEPWYAAVFEAGRQLGIPIVENINTPVDPYLCDAVKKYVYVSDYVRNVFGKRDPNHVTVYPGSDFEMFTRETNEHAPNDCVGMVYRLENDKLNLDSIQPFIQIAKLRPQTRILIVGGGSLLEPFKTAAETAGVAGCFEFTGYVPYEALPGLYRRMSVFVAPIWKESFGQVAPFAMSMKVPVIGYDVGAIGEIVGNPEMLAKPGDADQLARIAIRLMDSPVERYSTADFQQERAVKRFSVQAMIERYAGIYSEVTALVKDRL